ncbi:MAG: protein kinase [Planctomycetes bacterium]|nr:protein kinase [Planctomycetota bacterium]
MDEPTRPGAAPEDERIHDALAACIDAWHDGGPAAAERVAASRGDLAPVLRERLEKLQRAGLLPADDAPASEPAIPTVLGEFRLGKRIGGGGMGVVHLAEQMSLDRVVALKLVRPELRFFPGARARFRREVEAIARLGDAGIVPIYSVGEDQGIDFFAMEYVRGASLGCVLAERLGTPPQRLTGRDVAAVAARRADVPVPEPLPEVFAGTWVQTCCRIVLRMARAVHHAHERGIVHRDLKPNNTMVTPDGRVLLLDFGLAAAAGTARITRSGAVLGTLHYMAPEQLQDGSVDVRTDVYALGVTLHELLALRPPFHDQSQERLRQQILHGRAAPLRQQNPDVPRDVETIVGVARDRDPTRRYATAEALATDLERFLQHRPIQARPIGAWLRCVRWSQRHPALATAAGLVLLGFMATPLLVRWTRDAALQQSQNNLDTALSGVRGLLQQAGSKVLARVPGLDAERIRNLDAATALIERLWRENPTEPRVAIEYVRTMCRVSELQRLTGDNDAALRAIAAAEPVLAELRSAAADPAVHLGEVVGVRLARGLSLVELGRLDEAEVEWLAVLDAAATVPEAAWNKQVRLGLSSAHHNLARVVRERGDLAGAIDHMQRSFAIEAALAEADPSLDLTLNRARSRMNLAAMLRDKGDDGAARTELRQVREQLAAIGAADAKEPEVRRELARVDVALAAIEVVAGQFEQSLPMREAAITAMLALCADFPDRVVYRQEVDLMLHDLAVERQRAGDPEGALEAASRAIAGHEQLIGARTDAFEYLSELAIFLHHRGYLRAQTDETEAGADFTRAAERIEAVVHQRPNDLAFRMQAGQVLQSAATHAARQQQWPRARDTFRRAALHLEHVHAAGGRRAAAAGRVLAPLLQKRAQAELQCHDFDGVVGCLRRLHELAAVPVRELERLGRELHVLDREDFRTLLRDAGASGSTR